MFRIVITCFLLIFSLNSIGHEITAFGTSFTYGEDVSRSDAFPVKLEEKLNAKGRSIKVLNFSNSGDTTIDLLNRVNQIPKATTIVIFEYAVGNDQRAGIKPETTELNAATAIKKIIESNKQVLLILRGSREDRLKALVERWMPFMNETGVSYISIFQPASKSAATNPAYFHPNPAFHNEIADQLVDPIQKFLDSKK